MEEFIVSNDLVIFNEDHNPPTFETSNGNSNFDLTLGTESLISEVMNWEVLENATSSDHRPISYDTTAEPQLTKSHKIEYVVVTQFKILNSNFRYRHNSTPNVKVLAARLGTKGSASGNIAGVEAGSRAWLKGVGHFCLVFRNEHTLRRAIQYSKNL
jgi:hypothetical protein